MNDALDTVIDRLPRPAGEDCILVAIDGVDGAGKTTFADALAKRLGQRGQTAIRILLDEFLHPTAIRYRRGRDSPEGFFNDSYDYPRFVNDVLEPLGPGGSRRYRPRSYDRADDRPLEPEAQTAAPNTIVVLDGMFLHRDELFERWDLSVFLDVPFTETARRMSLRNGSHPDPEHPSMRRYVGGQRLYLERCDPRSRADIVIDNS